MGEVRGQFLAGDRFGFRHTFPEECGGFVPGAGPSPSPSPEAQKPAGVGPGLPCHYSSFMATPASSRVGKLIIHVSRLERGNLEIRLVGCRVLSLSLC